MRILNLSPNFLEQKSSCSWRYEQVFVHSGDGTIRHEGACAPPLWKMAGHEGALKWMETKVNQVLVSHIMNLKAISQEFISASDKRSNFSEITWDRFSCSHNFVTISFGLIIGKLVITVNS